MDRAPSKPMPIAATRMPRGASAEGQGHPRPSYCSGAVLVDPGSRARHRVKCNGQVDVVEHVNSEGQRWTVTHGLCASCGQRELENREELKAAVEAHSGPRKAGRKYDDE